MPDFTPLGAKHAIEYYRAKAQSWKMAAIIGWVLALALVIVTTLV